MQKGRSVSHYLDISTDADVAAIFMAFEVRASAKLHATGDTLGKAEHACVMPRRPQRGG